MLIADAEAAIDVEGNTAARVVTEAGRLKLKPQNLLVNLPLAERA